MFGPEEIFEQPNVGLGENHTISLKFSKIFCNTCFSTVKLNFKKSLFFDLRTPYYAK